MKKVILPTPQNFAFKIIVAGEGGVGKTTLLHKFVTGTFQIDMSMTIGVQWHMKEVQLGSVTYALHLWDLGGQDQFRFMLPNYTLGAKGAILMYDITRVSSLSALEEWAKICRAYTPDLPILLCGSKADLSSNRSVPPDFPLTYLEPLRLFGHLEVSAKTGQNVERAFEMITQKVIEDGEKTPPRFQKDYPQNCK